MLDLGERPYNFKENGAPLKNVIINIGLVICSILIVFAIFEIFLRITGYCPKKTSVAPPYLYTSHPVTWWTLRPNYNSKIRTVDGIVTYRINSQGIRAQYDIPRYPSTSRIFIIGDSFAFGQGINEEFTFPRRLESILKVKGIDMDVVNLGVPGFGTFHSYERLREYAQLLGNPNIVIYMFDPNDPIDNLAGKKEVVNGIRIDAHRKQKWLLSVIGHSYHRFRSIAFLLDRIYDKLFNPRINLKRDFDKRTIEIQSRKDFLSTVKYLSRLITWTDQRNVHLLVVTTRHSQYSLPLEIFLKQHQITLLEVSDIFERLNIDDQPVNLLEGHWNDYGHQLVVQGIVEYLFQKGWVKGKS